MSTTVADRQYELIAMVDMKVANIGANNGYDLNLPPGAVLLSATVAILEPFNGTTVTLTVADTAGNLGSGSLLGAIGTILPSAAIAPKVYPSGTQIHFTIAQTGTSTLGRAIGTVRYIALGRSNEVMT